MISVDYQTICSVEGCGNVFNCRAMSWADVRFHAEREGWTIVYPDSSLCPGHTSREGSENVNQEKG